MADSDDDYDRRRSRDGRDKFRRERSDYDRRDDRRKDSWDSDRARGSGRREMSGHGDRGGRDPYGRDTRRRDYDPQEFTPPHKRMRRDWDYDAGPRPYPVPYGGQPMHRVPAPWPPQHTEIMASHMPMEMFADPNQGPRVEVDYLTQPLLMTFKHFLSQQEDNISDQEAIKKYNNYKVEFKRQQINQFFLAHKDHEWFKSKYHPDECIKKKESAQQTVNRRLKVYTEMFKAGLIDSVSVDMDKAEGLVKLLDSVIIKLEGGTDFDLQSLEMTETTEENNQSVADLSTEQLVPSDTTNKDDSAEAEPTEEVFTLTESPVNKRKSTEDKKEVPLNLEEMTEEQINLQKAAQEFSKVRDQKSSKSNDKDYRYDSQSGSSSSSDDEDEPEPPGLNKDEKTDKEYEDREKPEDEKEEDTKKADDKPLEPRPLHKTLSIFLRHLAPSITKQEVEAICKKYQGYLRVALQDPLPERNFFRRGWVTFERTVNIRDICWNLNNIRLRDCELNATINRDLKQRVRPVNTIAGHRPVVRQDIQYAAKVITNLDSKWNLWNINKSSVNGEKTDLTKLDPSLGLLSRNPCLHNITQYLVEEGSYEEEELLGQTSLEQPKEASNELTVERDATLLQVLDRMILYLRIVHSVDYYSAAEFPNEDEMPHRCGIMHARSQQPVSKLSNTDVTDWMQNFETKIKHFINIRQPLDDKEVTDLGKKDPDAEVEKFVSANTQELGKDKYLCPLSGKKFKGPDFVRKHIFNKHQEKIEEVKKEVAYFNNYLMDPKRPQLPEHPATKAAAHRPEHPHANYHVPPYPGMMAYNHPRPMMPAYGMHPPPPYRGYVSSGGFRGDSHQRRPSNQVGRRDPRPIVEYRDLDAPDDTDIF